MYIYLLGIDGQMFGHHTGKNMQIHIYKIYIHCVIAMIYLLYFCANIVLFYVACSSSVWVLKKPEKTVKRVDLIDSRLSARYSYWIYLLLCKYM